MSKFNEIIKNLMFDAAPSEVLSVYKSLLDLTDGKNKASIIDVLQEYNIAHRIPITIDGTPSVISEYNKQGSKFYDPIKKKLFSVDYVEGNAMDIEPYDVDVPEEQMKVFEDIQQYLKSTFPAESACSVLSTGEEDNLAIIIVSMKFSPANFWSGYWKSEYIYNPRSKELKGKIDVSAHYYENGNVKFKFSESINEEAVKDIVTSIKRIETTFDTKLNVGFRKLNETQFSKLRRRLPVTRSKINWGKAIGNYRLGKDATKGSD
ncbi:HBR007Cp [Eremothecium sinecaudum]|uniref:F-actin-capping protein subunit alpha n=1 Tax=Eremothecium sinecaudum TaxID=45286 RepID=A0A109UWS0_9SACH|nr:HBR007Cp [Eremothecium sinecaudum]AMD18908.1 HBR007Cp [Eremothecium sinecaudum]